MTLPTRAAFLAAGAAALTACGKSMTSSLLPGLTPSASSRAPAATAALPIPQNVLNAPIIGEGWRFDGATAPAGWMKAAGQRLAVSQYRTLAAILGPGGSRDAATFLLPALSPAVIIAVNGTDPGNARALAALRRGAEPNHAVSVAGLKVQDALLRFIPLAPAAPKVESWYPGALPTPEQIEEARRTAH